MHIHNKIKTKPLKNLISHCKIIRLIILSLSFTLTLLMVGCTPSQKEPTYQFNSIVCDEVFAQTLAARPIKMVAPASGTDPKRIEKLKSLRYIDIPDNIMEKSLVYHSSTDAERLKFLKAAIYDSPKDTVIWTLRGGYGSARLLEEIKKWPKPKHEKIFIGYSDITALHLFFAQQWQWQPIHGAGLNELLNPERSPQNFKKITELLPRLSDLNSDKSKGDDSKQESNNIKKNLSKNVIVQLQDLKPLNQQAKNLKKVSGLLTGGNITIVESSLGTDWQIESENKILFLEDLNIQGYQLDRSLHHLKQAGVFKNVRAVVFGDFIKETDEVNFALDRFAKEMKDIPIFKSNQFGHGKYNYPLIYHSKASIKKESQADDSTYNLRMDLK